MDWLFFWSVSSWVLWLRKGYRLFNLIVIHVRCYPQRWQSLTLPFTCHSVLCIEETEAEKTANPPSRLNNVISLLSRYLQELPSVLFQCSRLSFIATVINLSSGYFSDFTTKLDMQVSKQKLTRLYFNSCLLFFVSPDAG